MPLKNYGVLKGKAIGHRLGQGSSPHYQILLVDDTTDYRIAVNVKSKVSPSELLYVVDENFQHPITEDLEHLEDGFTELDSRPGTGALDYIRGNLFDAERPRPLPHNLPGPDNDLNEKINGIVQRAISDERSRLFAFGERWGPEPERKDKYFGFLPGNGIHDIHMNQGNTQRFERDDGVWQDGGLLAYFPEVGITGEPGHHPAQWIAVFLAFQSQSWHTDDEMGRRIEFVDEDDLAALKDGDVRIIAALVNPHGPDSGRETVTLLNTTSRAINLDGWRIADKAKRKSALDGLEIEAGGALLVRLDKAGALLGNRGGAISLLDDEGRKIHGVSYTKTQATKSGRTLVF